MRVEAPVRICDIGGWTDTWFAGHGRVFSIAVQPGAWAEVETREGDSIEIEAPDVEAAPYGYRVRPGGGGGPGRQPLLEAAVDSLGLPEGVGLRVRVGAGVPPGCHTGTSAAVVVALLAAADDALGRAAATPAALARRAHEVETVRLGWQSGVQDQHAAATGGINDIEVRYPDAVARPVPVEAATWRALQASIVLVWLGRASGSSAVHEEVIAGLSGAAAEHPSLDRLRVAAAAAATSCARGDLVGLGAAMVEATEAQRALHPSLVSDDASALVEVARSTGAIGWKVNGAGGAGGSLTLLANPRRGDDTGAELAAAIAAAVGAHRVLPARLAARGARPAQVSTDEVRSSG